MAQNAGASGERVTTFTAPGGPSIMIIAASGAGQPQDLPNTRCQAVSIGGLSGRRCFDTISGSFSTTLTGAGRQYTISSSPHFVDQSVYQRMLDSFSVAP